MTNIPRIASAEPVLFGVVKIKWKDGFEGIVDLRSLIESMPMFSCLQADHSRFNTLKLESYGHKIFWLDDDGDEIDFGSASLRERAVRQSEILRLAS